MRHFFFLFQTFYDERLFFFFPCIPHALLPFVLDAIQDQQKWLSPPFFRSSILSRVFLPCSPLSFLPRKGLEFFSPQRSSPPLHCVNLLFSQGTLGSLCRYWIHFPLSTFFFLQTAIHFFFCRFFFFKVWGLAFPSLLAVLYLIDLLQSFTGETSVFSLTALFALSLHLPSLSVLPPTIRRKTMRPLFTLSMINVLFPLGFPFPLAGPDTHFPCGHRFTFLWTDLVKPGGWFPCQ